MNSPALICQPVSASDNKNPPFDNERERKRTRKSKLAKEGTNIFDLYLRKLNNDQSSFKTRKKIHEEKDRTVFSEVKVRRGAFDVQETRLKISSSRNKKLHSL